MCRATRRELYANAEAMTGLVENARVLSARIRAPGG
jgi:hypothetical protein